MDKQHNVNRDSLRVPLLGLFGMVFSVALVLYGQIYTLHQKLDDKLQYFEDKLDSKADKTQAGDRYTGSQAVLERQKNADAHKALQRQHLSDVQSLRREIDHNREEMIEVCK